jgi:hypothetical protein
MPNLWNLLVLEMGVEQHKLPTASLNSVDFDNKDAISVVLVAANFSIRDKNKWS